MNKRLSRLLITVEALILTGVLVIGFLGGLGTLGSKLLIALTTPNTETNVEKETENSNDEALTPDATVETENPGDSEVENTENYAIGDTESESAEPTEEPTEENVQPTVYEKSSYVETMITFSDEVEKQISEMSLAQRVGQLFLITPEQLVNMNFVRMAGSTTRAAIQEYPIFGLYYDDANFTDAKQMGTMLGNTQEYGLEFTGVDLMMAITETGLEGSSPVAKFQKLSYPGSTASLMSDGVAAVTSAAEEKASYLSKNGFSMVFSTEVEELGSVENASLMIAADIKGIQGKGLVDVVSTFPWNADRENKSSFQDLMGGEFSVFQAAIDAGAKVIMVSNTTVDAISSDTPCSMSSATVDILRGNMGYTGVLMTAPMSDNRITDNYLGSDAAVDAIVAGMDLIYSPLNFYDTYDKVLQAVEDGTISETRLHNAVGRILSLKLDN